MKYKSWDLWPGTLSLSSAHDPIPTLWSCFFFLDTHSLVLSTVFLAQLFFFFLVVVVLTHKTLEISVSPRLRSVPRILQPSEAVMALPYYGVEDVIEWISEIHDEGNKREGVVKERQTIVLRQTANLVNFIPPQLPTFFPPLAGKLSNPINSSKQWWCSIVCRLGCLQTCSLYANSPLVMHADALFLCPQSLCYANQTTGAL